MDNQGKLVSEEGRVPVGDGAPLLEALEGFRPMAALVKICPFWLWLHDVIGEAAEIGFHLAHARRLEAIAESKTKTDSVDARLLPGSLSEMERAAERIGISAPLFPAPAAGRSLPVRRVRRRSAGRPGPVAPSQHLRAAGGWPPNREQTAPLRISRSRQPM